MKENIVKSPYSIVKCHQQYPNRQRIVMATLNRAWVHYNDFNLWLETYFDLLTFLMDSSTDPASWLNTLQEKASGIKQK